MLKLKIINETGAQIHQPALNKIFLRFNKLLSLRILTLLDGATQGHVVLVILDDKKIHELNKEYRGKDRPTDVLSFAYLENNGTKQNGKKEFAGGKRLLVEKNFPGENFLGDIFISLDTAKKQALKYGHDLKEELKILFSHGLLHLIGFDHNTDEEEAEMEKWAKKILSDA